jgi:hypothetical protein
MLVGGASAEEVGWLRLRGPYEYLTFLQGLWRSFFVGERVLEFCWTLQIYGWMLILRRDHDKGDGPKNAAGRF